MGRGPCVLMVTGEYPPGTGGVGDYTAWLVAELASRGARVAVATGTELGDRSDISRTQGHRTLEARSPEPHPGDHGVGGDWHDAGERPSVHRIVPNWGFACWRAISAAAGKTDSNIVHLQYQAAAFAMQPAANLLPAYLRVRFRHVRVVTTFHDLRVPYLFPKAGPLRPWSILALDRLSHAVVATNRADMDELGGSMPRAKQRRWLIPIGSNLDNRSPASFDRAEWRHENHVREGSLLLSYFGFLNESKGFETLIDAAAVLRGRGIDVEVLAVGDRTGRSDPTNEAYARGMRELVEARGLGERVRFTGFLPAEQVSAALRSSDCCVLPYRDGASFRRGSLLAALAHGVPVVTTRPAKPEPDLVDGENVLMVEREDPGGLADAIERLCGAPTLRGRLGQGALAMSRRFRWDDIAERHMRMYEALLDGSSPYDA